MPPDGCEDVVEVVGDSTGQNPQAFEFLGVEQLAFHFQSLLFGSFSLGWSGVAVIAGISLAVALLTGLMSRAIVYRSLGSLR